MFSPIRFTHALLAASAVATTLGAGAAMATPLVVNFDLTVATTGTTNGGLNSLPPTPYSYPAFVQYAGQGAAGVGGTVWNTTTPLTPHINRTGDPLVTYTYSNVVDSNGNPTTIGFQFSYQQAFYADYFNNGNGGGAPTSDFGPTPAAPDTNPADPATLLQQFVFDQSASATVTVSGLTPGGSYNLYYYSVNGGYNGNGSEWLFGTKVFRAVATQDSSFVKGNNYFEVANAIADSSGNITGSNLTTSEADFNGFQVVSNAAATPEPASLALLAAGFAGLVLLGKPKKCALLRR